MIPFNRKAPWLPAFPLLILFVILVIINIKGGDAVLTRNQKQYLLDAHNDARRATGAPNMRAMNWSSSLAEEAERVASTCSKGPADRTSLSAAVNNRYSWIGENRHIVMITSPGAANNIDQPSLQQAFTCWSTGTSLGSCTFDDNAQILHPPSHLLGCGANVFSSNDRCHDVGIGILVVCFYAPGLISVTTDSGLTNDAPCTRCPIDAPHCVTGLCASETVLTPVPVIPVDKVTPTDPVVSSAMNRYGGFGGGTLFTLLGRGFSADQFNRDNPNLGNKVVLNSGPYNVTCEVVTYYTTANKITCRTGPVIVRSTRWYVPIVTVDGKIVRHICGHCSFQYHSERTPFINGFSKYAIVPGVDNGSIALKGRLFTYKLTDTQEGPSVFRTFILDRLLIGGELCNPWTDNGTEVPYGGAITSSAGYGYVKCKPTTNRIDSMNASIVVSPNGNSDPRYPNLLSIDNKMRQYMFQTHSDITRVVPNKGSPDGGTLITIYGKHMSDPLGDVKAYVSGVPCRVVNYTDDYIQCITGPAPPVSAVYPGGRGMVREVFLPAQGLGKLKMRPYGYPNRGLLWSIQDYLYRDSSYSPEFGESGYFEQRYTGFFIPPIDSLYTFNIISDDGSELYVSPDSTRRHKTRVAYITYWVGQGQWTRYQTQISKPIYMKAGKPYYMEAVSVQESGPYIIGLGVKVHNFTLTKDVAVADHEKQRLSVTSVVAKETQKIDVYALPKIQTITLELDGDINNVTTYYLSFNESMTRRLSEADNVTVISSELNSLQSVQAIGRIVVKLNMTSLMDDILELTFIFVSVHDDLPDIQIVNYTGISTTSLQRNSTKPSFKINFETRQTSLLPFDLPAHNLSTEVTNFFSTLCRVSNPGTVIFQATYDVDISRTSHHGYIDNTREPYCGRYSAKKPTRLWKWDTSKDERTNALINDSVVVSQFEPKYICFAYYGSVPFMRLTVTYISSTTKQTANYNLSLSSNTNQWNYICIDAFSIVHARYGHSTKTYRLFIVDLLSTSSDFWIDEFTIGTSGTRTMTQVNKALRPSGVFVSNVVVTKNTLPDPILSCGDSTDPLTCKLSYISYTVEFAAHNCGYNMSLMTTSSEFSKVTRILPGSPPVSGMFDFQFENITIYNISASSTSSQILALLNKHLSGGFTVAQISRSCTGYTWDITWDKRGGDLPLAIVNGQSLTGYMARVSIASRVDGGVWIRPLRGDMVRLPERKPQVQVSINGIPASCRSKMCDFEFTNDSIPEINSISPNSGGHDETPLTILGSNFGDNITQVTVTIGNDDCTVMSVNDTIITCIPVPSTAGLRTVRVHIDGPGYALSSTPEAVKFTYTLEVDSIEPNEGSISGGNIVMITGAGFPLTTNSPYSNNFYIDFDGHLCSVIFSNYTSVTCRPQPHSPATVNVTAYVNGVLSFNEDSYKYNPELVAFIDTVSPSSGPLMGGTALVITGRNFSTINTEPVYVSIGNASCNVTSVSTTVINCVTSSNTPGNYSVLVNSSSFGIAITNADYYSLLSSNTLNVLTVHNLMTNTTSVSLPFSNLLEYTYGMSVSSITPCSGSLGGSTLVSISGTGFSPMTTVTIGGKSCTPNATTLSNSLIQCTTPSLAGQYYTIENNGSHEDIGLYFAWSPNNIQILQGDTVTWKWIGSRLSRPQTFEVHQSSSLFSLDQLKGGFQSPSSIDGNFSYTFTQPGVYYYATFIDLCGHCIMSGSINVTSLSNTPSEVRVREADSYEATYNLNIGDNNDIEEEEDEVGSSSGMSDCVSCRNLTNLRPSESNPLFVYSLCDTPIVNEIEPQNSTIFSTITLYGSGFGFNMNRTSVMFGDYSCIVLFPYTNEQITCMLGNGSYQPTPYLSLPLSLYITNKGYGLALNEDTLHRALVIKPVITGLSPLNGSVLGGNILTISGASFISTDLKVYLEYKECIITSVSYYQIKCIIPSSNVLSNSTTVAVNVTYGADKEVVCTMEEGCVYEYLLDSTPSIQTVYPSILSGDQQTLISVTGTHLQLDAVIKIGSYNCTNVTVISSDNVTCFIRPIQASQYRLSILVLHYGYAQFQNEDDSVITSLLKVDSFYPQIGSIRGGTMLTLTGIGFSDYISNNSISISNRSCIVRQSNYTTVVCSTPDLGREGNYSISVIVAMHPSARSKRNADLPLVFSYDLSYTPQVTSVQPSSGQEGDIIVIKGIGFTDTAMVSIGSSNCKVSSQPSNSTDITCLLGANYVGVYPLAVVIFGKGRAISNVNFTYTLHVRSFTPTMNSFAGLNTLTISGVGFDPVATFITICDRNCTPSSRPPSLTSITCIVPSFSDLVLNNDSIELQACVVNVTSLSTTVSLPQSYILHRDLTPFIVFINRTRGGTAGGSLLQLNGTGFTNNVTVTIAGTLCTVRDNTESVIVCETGASGRTIQAPVMVYIEGKGYAVSTAEYFYYVDVWSSPYTWGGTGLPKERDFVIVPAGQTLVLDIRTPVLTILLIQGGVLLFDDVKDGVELHSEYILITDGGKLQIGTEQTPYQHKAQIVMYGNRVSTELPLFGAKTLAVRNGTLDLHGKPIMNTWTCLSQTVRPGKRVLVVKHDVSDWEVGGLITVATTSFSIRENEELTIESISNDGRNITVTTPLKYTHISVTQTIHGQVIETCAEVGYLTRNVVFRGNRNTEWDRTFENCERDFNPGQFAIQSCFNGRFGSETIGDQFGSQIMLHRGPRDTVVGRISYIEVTHAGQAFRLGRYPIHFHLNGDVNGSYVRGCGIHHTFNRAVTIHGVDNLLVEKNVAYRVLGHAYFLEDGIEEGNIIQYNLGIFVIAASSLLNVDITPATFWSVNPNNIFRHNAAAGGTHFGFWYRLPTHPTGPSFTTSVKPLNRPLAQFYNNSAHSFGWYGIWVFPSYHPVRPSTCNEVTPAVFDTFLAWRNNRGIEFTNVGALQVKRSVMLENIEAGIEYSTITATWGKKGALIEDVLVVSHSDLRHADGIRTCTRAGIKTPNSYYLTVSNVTLVNFNESGCYALQACSHCPFRGGGHETRFENTILVNSPNIALWHWENEQVFRDITGNLTGTPGASLLPTTGILPSNKCKHHIGSSFGNVNGSVCEPDVDFVLFKLKSTTSPRLGSLNVSNQYGVTLGPNVLLPTKEIYQLDWVRGHRIINISYDTTYSGMTRNDYLWIRHKFKSPIDTVSFNNRPRTSEESFPLAGSSNISDWYGTENNTIVTYYVVGSAEPTCFVDVNLKFSTYQCYYKGCVVPTPSPTTEPPTEEPTGGTSNFTQLWSNVSTWPNEMLPIEDSDVYIDCNEHVLVDVSFIPRLNILTICGRLEFIDDRDYFLEANRILIDGGQLLAGENDKPFQHDLIIVLNGDLSSHEYRLPNYGPVLGAKGLGVFGELSLHGKERLLTWTVLAETAMYDSTQLVLRDTVDWVQGEEIVIASTYYEAKQTEERTIVNISSDGKTISINRPLVYSHLGGEHNSQCCKVNISAEVGLLSRNIKILGTHPNATTDVSKQESYGCRVLVSGYFNSTQSLYKTGSARLSGVEFKGCGQEGFTELFDPRFALAFLSTGTVQNNSSYIKSCSFHNGYSTGIGVFGANDMIISNNVVHRTVGPSFLITGRNHVLRNNLAVVALFPGTYRVPEEPRNAEWTANYELAGASNVLLIGNSAAGGAKAGFHTNGEDCIRSDFIPLWRDNIAHSTLHGIHLGYGGGHNRGDMIGCSAFHKFTVYSCYNYGLFAFSKAGVLITNSTFVNNYAAIYTSVIGPHPLSHRVSDKTVIIRDTVIISSIHPSIGVSINCTEYKRRPEISFHLKSFSPGIQSPRKGHVGIILTSFTSGSGGFPSGSWTKKKGLPAIAGLTKLINVKFCNFGTHCSSMREVALMTDPSGYDAQHPVWLEQVSYLMGSNSSKFYNHNPSLGKINPADCVDMDCDGLKKILIRDIDGSFTGTTSQGLATLISRSEYQWDRDRRHGLGDYRIPILMLSRADGSRIDTDSIYPNKGIYRGNNSCQWRADWNSYYCTDIDHMMLIIESLDADTLVRRLSPIGVGADKYIDLINGPQDQGWCGGYTCQERISTFYAIVSTGLNYTIGLTSTNPQRTNFRLLNANESQSLMIAYIYNNPQRLDVYVGSEYIIPTNGYMKDGNLRYRRGSNFIPSPSANSHGANYYDRNEKKLYIVIKGSRAVRVETTPVIQLGFDLPPVTMIEFFEVNLVRNLALLLGITPNRIRVVNVISEGGTRKREVTGHTRVEVEIGNPPSNETIDNNGTDSTVYNVTSTGPTAQDNETFQELLNITTKVSEIIQTGELSKEIGYKILDAQLIEPKPIVSDPTGGERATNETGGPQPGDEGTQNLTTFSKKQFQMDQEERNSSSSIVLNIPTRLVLLSIPTQVIEGVPVGTSLRVAIYDESGSVVPTLGVRLPWQLTISIVSSSSNGVFLINETASFISGIATFNDLTFSHPGQYRVMFQVTYPSNANFTLTIPNKITVLPRPLYLSIIRQPPSHGNTTFPLSSTVIVHVLDMRTSSLATNLGWRGRMWYMSASFITEGRVLGQSVNVTIQRGVANFSSLHISEPGSYRIRFSLFTSDGYQLPKSIDSTLIEIVEYQFTRLTIVFSNNYSEIVLGKEEMFIDEITKRLQTAYPDVYIYNVTVSEGSIIISLFATSRNVIALDNLIRQLPSSPAVNQFTFNNITLSLVSVEQDLNYPIVLPPAEDSNRQLIIIICGSLGGVILLSCILLIVTIVAIVSCNCWKKNDSPKKENTRVVFKDDFYSSATIYSNTPIFDENDDEYPTFHLKAVEDTESLHQQYPPIKAYDGDDSKSKKMNDNDNEEEENEKGIHFEKAEPNIYTTFL